MNMGACCKVHTEGDAPLLAKAGGGSFDYSLSPPNLIGDS